MNLCIDTGTEFRQNYTDDKFHGGMNGEKLLKWRFVFIHSYTALFLWILCSTEQAQATTTPAAEGEQPAAAEGEAAAAETPASQEITPAPQPEVVQPAATTPTQEVRTIERAVEARSADDGMVSMVRSLYFADTFLINGIFHFMVLF